MLCPAGHCFFAQGTSASHVFLICEGRVKLSTVSRAGKEAIVAILVPGEFFGEMTLGGHPTRSTTATALTESVVRTMDRRTLEIVLRRKPDFARQYVKFLLERNARIEADLIDQLFNSTEKRLARTLLLLAHFEGSAGARIAVPKMSQTILAEMVGTTRTRVNFFMNRFKKLGYIKYNGGLEVSNSLVRVLLHD